MLQTVTQELPTACELRDGHKAGILEHFKGQTIAFAPILLDDEYKGRWGLGVAVRDQAGVHHLPGMFYNVTRYQAAQRYADALNNGMLGMTVTDALAVIATTMRGDNDK